MMRLPTKVRCCYLAQLAVLASVAVDFIRKKMSGNLLRLHLRGVGGPCWEPLFLPNVGSTSQYDWPKVQKAHRVPAFFRNFRLCVLLHFIAEYSHVWP